MLSHKQHGPDAVLLTHVVAAGARAFLAADRDAPGVEQVAEELPARRRLEARDAELGGDAVNRAAGGHGAGHAREAAAIGWREMSVCREHCHASPTAR